MVGWESENGKMQVSHSLAPPNPSPHLSAADGDGIREMYVEVLVETKTNEEDDELSFMKRLKSADWERYCFQKDMIRFRPPFGDREIIYGILRRRYSSYENQSFPIIKARDLDGGVKHYNFDELMRITDSFRSSFICYTVFGTLHRGTIQTESGVQDVLVKTWEYFFPFTCDEQHRQHTSRIHDELNLLRDPEIKSLPNVVKLIGFHCERRLAVIYEGGSFELLHSIIPNDTFSWADRKKVAIDVAIMLEAFHDKGLVHGGVNSKNIMVDKEKCPVVFDFRLFSYCKYLEDCEPYIKRLYGFHVEYLDGPSWSVQCDIFSYGILLLELINKKVYPLFTVSIWTKNEILDYDYEESAVHSTFYVDQHVAVGITKLAINCLNVNPDEQPTIQCIVKELKELFRSCPPNKLQKISG